MIKTVSVLVLAGIVTFGLVLPAQADFNSYTSMKASPNGTRKARPSPTPAGAAPIAKSNSDTHKAAPTPTPVPLQSINVMKTPIKTP